MVSDYSGFGRSKMANACIWACTCTCATLVPSHLTGTIYINHLNFHYFPWKVFVIDFRPLSSISFPAFTHGKRYTVKLLYLLKCSHVGAAWKNSVLLTGLLKTFFHPFCSVTVMLLW